MFKRFKATSKRLYSKAKSTARWAYKHPLRAAWRGAMIYTTLKQGRGIYNGYKFLKNLERGRQAARAARVMASRRDAIYL